MSDFNINMPVQQGWQCPICKRVYSPFTPMCYYCGNKDKLTSDDQITFGPNTGSISIPKDYSIVYCTDKNDSYEDEVKDKRH